MRHLRKRRRRSHGEFTGGVMSAKILVRHLKILATISFYLLVVSPLIVSAAQVSLHWDAGSPAPEGYRIYQRSSGQAYDYESAVWTGTASSCTIDNLSEGETYYFVVRAFIGAESSEDSNEVSFNPATQASNDLDSDGDGANDAVDDFPTDPNEWLDTDSDGIGNNADEDDDGDGMSDSWEQQYGLNPLGNDAGQDLDGDGVSNLEEFQNQTDPSINQENQTPTAPSISSPVYGVLTNLNPEIKLSGYADEDGDIHLRTRYQISIDTDFTQIIFDRTSSIYLTDLTLPDLILDPDTTYYLRTQFIDARNGVSGWSETRVFNTSDYSSNGDSNANGVLDAQEPGEGTDLDGDGTNDQVQAGIVALSTPDPTNSQIAVKRQDSNVQVVAARAYGTDGLGLASHLPAAMTGLVCFKLYLENGVGSAQVTIHLTKPAPEDGTWYKYDIEEGWYIYPNVAFSADRLTVTLMLEDGGVGDQDGVRNGVIVDPAGLAYNSGQSEGDSSSSNDDTVNGGCFIGVAQSSPLNSPNAAIPIVLIMAVGTGLLWRLAFRKSRAVHIN